MRVLGASARPERFLGLRVDGQMPMLGRLSVSEVVDIGVLAVQGAAVARRRPFVEHHDVVVAGQDVVEGGHLDPLDLLDDPGEKGQRLVAAVIVALKPGCGLVPDDAVVEQRREGGPVPVRKRFIGRSDDHGVRVLIHGYSSVAKVMSGSQVLVGVVERGRAGAPRISAMACPYSCTKTGYGQAARSDYLRCRWLPATDCAGG